MIKRPTKNLARIVSSSFLKSVKNKDPRNIKVEHIYAYLSQVERKSSSNTLRNYSIALRSFLRFLGRKDLAEKIKPIRQPQTIRVIPTSDEVQRMIEVADKPWDRLVLQTLIRTGLRVGEFCNLMLSDIDLKKGRSLLGVKVPSLLKVERKE